ncbi:MAG: HET-C-related protein [Thermosynechococcaceae cyanobacterium]
MARQPDALQPEFSLDYHAELTTKAASDVLSESQLKIVIFYNLAQDVRQWESEVHFDNCAFTEGAKHIRDEWAKIEADSNRLSDEALTTFGRLLHTAQDFYAHSNWIELHLDQDLIPLWDFQIATLPQGIVSGTWAIGFPKNCSSGAPSHDELNKDKPDSPEGKKVVESGSHQGKTYFILAWDAALRESRKQLTRLVRRELDPLPEVGLDLTQTRYSR